MGIAAVAAMAQRPTMGPRSIVNAASFMAGGLPAGSIAQGSIFSIFGTNLGPAASPPLAFPLATTLGGVAITVTQGTTSVNAIPLYVSPRQINALMPSNTPLGPVSVQVSLNGTRGSVAPARIVASSFGIFSINSGGSGPGVMQNYVSATQQPVNAPATAAKPGQLITLYGTGLGPALNPDNMAPAAGNLPTQVDVLVGGQPAAIAYSGRSPCCSGLDQIVFTVPAGAPLGCWVPLQIRTAGATVSNAVTMAISSDGSPCSDPANAFTQPFLGGKRLGLVAMLRTAVTEDVGLKTPATVTTDASMITFQQEGATPFGFNPIFSLPPAGTCTAYTATGDLFDGDPMPGAGTSGKFLDEGQPVVVAGSGQRRNIARPADNSRNFQPLGYTYDGSLVPSTLFLNPGSIAIQGAGGADVGAFQGNFTVSAPLTWTNRDQTTSIIRSQGFTVNWSGAPTGQSVIIFGGGVDMPSNASALFVCVAPQGASSFTIPGSVLANIAATRSNLLQSKGAVYVGALPTSNPTTFTANNLDFGAILPGTFIGKTVIFQ
jgi:uncharacterized protein (TIGR03437 family)